MAERIANGAIVVHLKDGRTIDLSGETPAGAILRLKELGVRPTDIERTVHRVDGVLWSHR